MLEMNKIAFNQQLASSGWGHWTLKHWTRLPTTTHSTSTRTKSLFFLKSVIISLARILFKISTLNLSYLCENISDNPLGRSQTKRTRPVMRVLPALLFYLRSLQLIGDCERRETFTTLNIKNFKGWRQCRVGAHVAFVKTDWRSPLPDVFWRRIQSFSKSTPLCSHSRSPRVHTLTVRRACADKSLHFESSRGATHTHTHTHTHKYLYIYIYIYIYRCLDR